MDYQFIKLADLPPDPTDKDALLHYKDMGFTVCLITEDDVKLVDRGTVSQDYKNAIKNISDAGMQVWIRNMFNDPDYFISEGVTAGSNYGSPYEMKPRCITDEFSEFPAVTGFYMADEAYMYRLPERVNVEQMGPDSHKFASFDQLCTLVDWKNKYYPDAFFHMNHVPSQSWDHYLPRDGKIYNYEDFLTEYANTILKRLKGCGRSLCLDHYPFLGEDYIEKDYLFDLMTAAKVTKAYNAQAKPEDQAVFGICLQTFAAKGMADERCRDITMPEEVTFQMYVGMALGVRLFEYFAYRSYRNEFLGILAPDGSDRIYDIVKTASDRAAFFEPVLMQYESIGAYVVPGKLYSYNIAAMVQAKELFCKPYEIGVQGEYDTLVGCFACGMRKAYMLVNYTDPVRKRTNTVTLHGCAAEVMLYKDGKRSVLKTNNGVATITIEPGNCAFVVW